MKKCKWTSLAAAAVMTLFLAGCSTSFADYDVSGYFQALLDSSYKSQNTEYVNLAATSEEKAEQNNVTTVQNAAVNFCNTYGITPNDEQFSKLQDVMREALRQADYTVKDEQKVEQGYYLEVEIAPIVNFSGLDSKIEDLRKEAQEEASRSNATVSSQDEDSSSSEEDYGYDGTDYGEDSYAEDSGYGEEESSQESSLSSGQDDTKTVNANELFVDKVIAYCQGQISAIQFSDEPVTISLDIRQTAEGELQLDTNQLDTIDRTVLQFQK